MIEFMKTLVIATRNAHKVGEIRAILGENFRYLMLEDLPGAPDVVEDAPSFAGNATTKAVGLARWLSANLRALESLRTSLENNRSAGASATGSAGALAGASHAEVLVLADDSGLEVDALGGAPGVHSARFAALDSGRPGNSPTGENNTKLLRLLKDVPHEQRTARFKCVIALAPVPESHRAGASPVCYADEAELGTELFEGVCEGRITTGERGRGGFGYDPLFIPEGFHQTFGELPEDVKNQLSHRAKALFQLKQRLKQT